MAVEPCPIVALAAVRRVRPPVIVEHAAPGNVDPGRCARSDALADPGFGDRQTGEIH